jgi:ubiquinone biosynthesis protein COQ9
MNEPLLKERCDRTKFSVLTTENNWPEAKKLLEEVIRQVPEARFSDAEILQAFEMAGMDTNDKEAQLINAVRFLLAKGAENNKQGGMQQWHRTR